MSKQSTDLQKEPISKQSVNLSKELVARMQMAYQRKHGSFRSAVQHMLERGAELALAEFTGENGTKENLNSTVHKDKDLSYNANNLINAANQLAHVTISLVGVAQQLQSVLLATANERNTSPETLQRITDLIKESEDNSRSVLALADATKASPRRPKRVT